MSKFKVTSDYVEDQNGNRNYINHFGSLEAAQAALESLILCRNSVNCENCWYCLNLENCTNCADSKRLVNCSCCVRCKGLQDCSWLRDCDSGSGKVGVVLEVPEIKHIHQKVFSKASKVNALNMNYWTVGENAHCWGGWVGVLGGDSFKLLENFFSSQLTGLIAQMILKKSSPLKVPVSFFFITESEALKEMKDLADKELALRN